MKIVLDTSAYLKVDTNIQIRIIDNKIGNHDWIYQKIKRMLLNKSYSILSYVVIVQI